MSRALILLDHGSRRPAADAHLRGLAAELRRRRPGLTVRIAHLELAPPSLADALAECEAEGCRRVWIYPLLLAPGRHLERDLPEQLARGARAHPGLQIELLEPLGSRPELAELVLAGYEARAGEAAAPGALAPPQLPRAAG